LALTANEGLTVSRRLKVDNNFRVKHRSFTTGTQVSTESEFITALGDNIMIELERNITLTATININGTTGLVINGNNYKVDGNDAVRCFVIQNAEVSFKNLTIMNGKTNYPGSGVYIVEGATVSFTSCPFTSNEGTNGGAVFIYKSTASFTSCPFTSNEADSEGGAFYLATQLLKEMIFT